MSDLKTMADGQQLVANTEAFILLNLQQWLNDKLSTTPKKKMLKALEAWGSFYLHPEERPLTNMGYLVGIDQTPSGLLAKFPDGSALPCTAALPFDFLSACLLAVVRQHANKQTCQSSK